MKRIALALASGLTLVFASGCVVAPPRHASAAVYVAPSYDSPGPDWTWRFHARYGWGWHHHRHGWHRGWH